MKYEIMNATFILFSHFSIISVPLIRQLDIAALLIPGLDIHVQWQSHMISN